MVFRNHRPFLYFCIMARRKKTKRRNIAYIALGFCIVIGIYVFILANYAVFPFSNRWRAIYSSIDLPDGYSIYGLDISHHQGDINWENLEKAKIGDNTISFLFIKATEGISLLDENFNENFFQAQRHGFIRGAYHYYKPNISSKEQAAHFLHQVHLDEGDLPPVLDIEERGEKSIESFRADVLHWLKTVEKAYGVKPILYTFYKFKMSYLNTEDFEEYPFWIAHHYVTKLSYEGPWKFWQFTERGRVNGIRENVDINVYNGSIYDLRRMTIVDESILYEE